MTSAVPLRAAFVFWGAWELANAGLATFAPNLGARMVGWDPAFGWNSDVLAMSQQYGMTMFLLGFAYLLAATNPVRYAPFVWVAVAEQVLGILIGFNDAFVSHSAAPGQFLIFVIVNSVIAAIFILLRPTHAHATAHAGTAHSAAHGGEAHAAEAHGIDTLTAAAHSTHTASTHAAAHSAATLAESVARGRTEAKLPT